MDARQTLTLSFVRLQTRAVWLVPSLDLARLKVEWFGKSLSCAIRKVLALDLAELEMCNLAELAMCDLAVTIKEGSNFQREEKNLLR